VDTAIDVLVMARCGGGLVAAATSNETGIEVKRLL
jgi:hypothetical protein